MSVIAFVHNPNEPLTSELSSLEQAGYEIIELSSAEEIIDVLSGMSIDIYILNLPLSFVSASAATRLIRRCDAEVGIILKTSSVSAMNHGLDEGADLCLVKPVAPETLLAATTSLSRRLNLQSVS